MERIREIVNAMMKKEYISHGIESSCEECFYLADPKCPNPGVPYICVIDEALNDREQRQWVLENLADKVAMRRDVKEKVLKENPKLTITATPKK